MNKIEKIINQILIYNITVEEGIKKLEKVKKYSKGKNTKLKAKNCISALSIMVEDEMFRVVDFEKMFLTGWISKEELNNKLLEIKTLTISKEIEEFVIKTYLKYNN